jgi:hypothetical protein
LLGCIAKIGRARRVRMTAIPEAKIARRVLRLLTPI